MRSRQNHLLVRAYINGRPAWLGVDSGAPVSAIAVHRREHFRLTPITAKSNLPARIQINGAFNNVAIARELRLGALTLVDEPVVAINLGNSARAGRLDEQSWRRLLSEAFAASGGRPDLTGFLAAYATSDWLQRLRAEEQARESAA